MQTVTVQSSVSIYPPLEQVTRPTVPTAAAYYLNKQQQTHRALACLVNDALRSVRISGRLVWRIADIRALLEGGTK